MTSTARSAKGKDAAGARGVSRWIPWVVLGLTVAVLMLLSLGGPSRLLRAFSGPSGPLSLTIIHTNDTWGYVRPCG